MLAQTLQWLKHDGSVHRTTHKAVPSHVKYGPTPLGREAAEKVRGLADHRDKDAADREHLGLLARRRLTSERSTRQRACRFGPPPFPVSRGFSRSESCLAPSPLPRLTLEDACRR
jgi:hypothetical protein